MSLTPKHAAYLVAHAVDLELATSLGVRSVASVTDLPEDWRPGLGRHVPGIVLPWTSHDGRVSPQLRPDTPFITSSGDEMKYAFQRGVAPVLWAVRYDPRATKCLFIEGSKQCLVAATYAPTEYNVFGLAGCWGWSHDGVPIQDLEVADYRDVVAIFDADAKDNPDVYNAGLRLTEALKMNGAVSVKWVRLPAGRNAGLDDVLAAQSPDRRPALLGRLIADARDKIADARPKAKRKAGPTVRGSADRPLVEVDDDRLVVITSIVKHLIAKLDGTELFNRGGVISRLDGEAMRPITSIGDSHDLIAEAMMPVIKVDDNDYRHCWPDRPTVEAVLSRAREFTPLDRVTHVPFVRPDGTWCGTAGYDPATATILLPSPALGAVSVPERPTPEQVRAARELLLDEWLGDMAFPDEASRAGALAMMLTPFIRGRVYTAPLAVVDGLQMGVGKGLLANCLSILTTGRVCDPKPFSADDEENRKALLGSFRAGDELIVWDEAHILHGANLARAITAITYSDRVLGSSRNEAFPNRCTWVSLGNQVRVHGDIVRRVYRIELIKREPVNGYRHPELHDWTVEHRAELISACGTLVRAWFVAGQPLPFGAPAFPSFEQWQRTVGGILAHAGVPGFLTNVKNWREESDPISQWWEAHLEWLREKFETDEFTTADVRSMALGDPGGYQAPLNLDDITAKGYAKQLGEAYSRIKDRRYGGLYLHKVGVGQRKVSKWIVGSDDDRPEPGVAPAPETAAVGRIDPQVTTAVSPSTESAMESETGAGADSATPAVLPGSLPVPPAPSPPEESLMIIDLETGSATELHSAGPEWLRLGGYASGDGVELTTDFADLTRRIQSAHVVTGHNVMGFDLLALARHHGLDILELTRRGAVFDTLLAARFVDPPMARERGFIARRYDLDSLGRQYELGGKVSDLKALSKEFGGFDKIPTDDSRYRAYLTGDIELSHKLYLHLKELAGDSLYLRREHRVAAVAASITLNGFRVDLDLLDERLAEGERVKVNALRKLHEHYGIPLEDEAGEHYASPLATKAGKAALIEALTSRGVGPKSFWVTGKTGDIATSREAMQRLGKDYHHLPEVREICKLVAAVVSVRTVYQTVHNCLVGDRVHPGVTMKQSTGRWSLTRPGLTVMGKRGGRYREREVFVAEPGHVIIACDLSQVDMRAVAGLSGDPSYIDMLRHEDPHAEIAKLLFGTAAQREEAKKIGHGWNYGRGIRGICTTYDLEPAIVRQFDTSMRERFPRLVEWQNEVRALAESGELLDNGFGRKMRPDPTRAHTQGPALMGQGCARDIMMTGLLRLPDECLPMLRAQVHDEIVLSVPAADAVDIQRAVTEALSFDWEGPGGTVPIVAEGGPTDRESWGAVYAK